MPLNINSSVHELAEYSKEFAAWEGNKGQPKPVLLIRKGGDGLHYVERGYASQSRWRLIRWISNIYHHFQHKKVQDVVLRELRSFPETLPEEAKRALQDLYRKKKARDKTWSLSLSSELQDKIRKWEFFAAPPDAQLGGAAPVVEKAACVPISGPGLENGLYRCYFNATLKALLPLIPFTDQIQSRKERVEALIREIQDLSDEAAVGKKLDEIKRNSELIDTQSDVVSRSQNMKEALLNAFEAQRLLLLSTLAVMEKLRDNTQKRPAPLKQWSGPVFDLIQKLQPFMTEELDFDEFQERDAQEFFSRFISLLFPTARPLSLQEEYRLTTEGVHLPTVEKPSSCEGLALTVKFPRQPIQGMSLQRFFEGLPRALSFSTDLVERIEMELRDPSLNPQPKHVPIQKDGDEGGSVEVQSRFCLTGDAPKILPIQLGRFVSFSGRSKKRFDPIDIPPIIHVPYRSKPGEPDKLPERYILRSVVIHAGWTINTGHYYAYVPKPDSIGMVDERDEQKGFRFLKWMEHNDRSVDERSFGRIQEDMRKNAYLVFYERVE